MPATRQALEVTEAYRRSLAKLTDGALKQARTAWSDVSFDDLRASYGPVRVTVERSVRAAQTEAVRLTAGYVSAFLSAELGEPTQGPHLLSVLYVGKSFGGKPLYQSLLTPIIVTLSAIKDGKPDPMGLGLRTLLVNVDLDVKHAARASLMYAIQEDDRISGWSRAIRGTCGACAAAATGNNDEASFEVHPGCQCVAEPFVPPKHVADVVSPERTMQPVVNVGEVPPPPAGSVFTRADQEAIAGFEGSYTSMALNAELRSGVLGAESEARVAALDTALAHAGQLDQATQAFRMIGSLPDDLGMRVGTTFTEKGYSSTAAQADVGYFGARPTRMELSLSPRLKALWGGNPLEGEILIERDARYVIRAVESSSDESVEGGVRWTVKAEVLPPETRA